MVYGEKWTAAGAPMSILAIAGIFLNVIYPCGVVLAAQNRLKQELSFQGYFFHRPEPIQDWLARSGLAHLP